MIRLPEGIGLLVDRRTRTRLVLAFVGSFAVAMLEIVALATLVPLMQLLSGATPTLGFLTAPGGLLAGLDSRGLATLLAGVIFVAFLVKGLFGLAYRWWVGGFVIEQQIRTSVRLLEYYLRAPYPLHLSRGLGDFTRRLNDAVGQAYGGVVMGCVNVLVETTTVLAIAVTLLVATPLPALGMLLYFGVAGTALYLVVRNRALAAGRTMLAAAEEVFSNSVQPLQNIKDVKLRDNSPVFLKLYEKARAEGAMAGRVAGFLSDFPKFTLEIMFVLGVAILTAALFWGAPTQSALGTLALFALAGFRVLPSLTRLMASLNGIKASQGGLEMVLEELVAAEAVRHAHREPAPRLPFERELVIEDVTFSYESSPAPVLKGINLRIPAGTSVALVGGSGAGKTTLADILLGLLPPTSGRVLADGVDIQTNLRGWQQNLGMVPQSVIALVGSAIDNISFRDPDFDLRKVKESAAKAQLDQMIEALPRGYESNIGPGGAGLSGGERQRLGLARALYRDPQFLILDEATSALDNATERRITDAIDDLQGTMTILIIAHRLSTVRRCDMIVFMKDGQIEDVGSFDELRARNEDFAYLVKLGSLDALTM